MSDGIFEMAILGRVVWDLHSLNNEGTVGNVTEPRTVVLANGEKTDGISGEMLKHIHAENLWILEANKDSFCEACKRLEPARADKNTNVTKKNTPQDAVRQAIIDCTLCDAHGFLIQKPNVARPSTIEFGWAVGIPEIHRDIHLHARHALGEKVKPKGAPQTGKCDSCGRDNVDVWEIEQQKLCKDCAATLTTSQMIYHRPTRSGAYAVVTVFQPWKIGLNNVNYAYEIDDNKRKERYNLVLKAYQTMFMRTEGAMTTTRLPHTEGFEGLIVVSKANMPAPIISPLREDYKDEIKKIATMMNQTSNQSVNENEILEVMEFSSISSFIEKMKGLLERRPYKLTLEK